MCRNNKRSLDDNNLEMSTDQDEEAIVILNGDGHDEEEDEDEDEEEDEYVVEAIRAWRYHFRNQRKEFLIKWQGWPESTNTWEPEDNLKCDELMEEFVEELEPAQLRFYHCDPPTKLTGFKRNAEYIGYLGTDGPHESDDEETGTKTKRNKAYVLVKFADSDLAEEVSLEEFFHYQPQDALKFCEERILCRKDSASSSSQSDDQCLSASTFTSTSRDRSHE